MLLFEFHQREISVRTTLCVLVSLAPEKTLYQGGRDLVDRSHDKSCTHSFSLSDSEVRKIGGAQAMLMSTGSTALYLPALGLRKRLAILGRDELCATRSTSSRGPSPSCLSIFGS